MKLLTTTAVSAAILAAASFGATAQTQQQMPQGGSDAPSANRPAPSQGGGAGEARGGAGGAGGSSGQAAQPGQPGGREAQSPGGSDRPARADTGDKAGAKSTDGKAAADSKSGADGKAAADSKSGADGKAASDSKSSDSMNKDSAQKSGGDNKSADQAKSGEKQASKEIKPEQKTVIKQTIVKQNIRPAKIDVDVRVGVAIPRTVVLHPLPPAIIEVYPAYRSYRLVLVDDNTILVIDPDTWMIVDIIEV
jgi:hypothetical protein